MFLKKKIRLHFLETKFKHLQNKHLLIHRISIRITLVFNFFVTLILVFLKHSPCLHEKVKQLPDYRSICVKDLQSGYEWIQNTFKNDSKQQFRSMCCVYNRWEKCITDYLLNKCGPHSDQAIRVLIGSATTFLLEEFCKFNRYDPESNLCQLYFQPKDMIPKGLLSNSYASWFFSYQCPNIGYGVILEKDI